MKDDTRRTLEESILEGCRQVARLRRSSLAETLELHARQCHENAMDCEEGSDDRLWWVARANVARELRERGTP